MNNFIGYICIDQKLIEEPYMSCYELKMKQNDNIYYINCQIRNDIETYLECKIVDQNDVILTFYSYKTNTCHSTIMISSSLELKEEFRQRFNILSTIHSNVMTYLNGQFNAIYEKHEKGREFTCVICYDEIYDKKFITCETCCNSMCSTCVEDYDNNKCPICRTIAKYVYLGYE